MLKLLRFNGIRCFSQTLPKVTPSPESALSPADYARLSRLRNIGISAHIDSGKTTLTERILYYTGRIDAIHEVRGRDGVGAKMDSMELEREKGITIQSAATYTLWKETNINIIDTPGHVDFTIEVERALRVLDGAVLVLCSVSGVQSQTMTVNKQMQRYRVPRLVFINKCDRAGAAPFQCIQGLQQKLKLNAAAVQIPIGLESHLRGVVDLVQGKALYFDGECGERVRIDEIPESMQEEVKAKRHALVAALAEVDEEMSDYFLEEKEPESEPLKAAIRRSTLQRVFVPVFMGSAYKNVGVQALLDGVVDYLPTPYEVDNVALDRLQEERECILSCSSQKPLVALAFKLEESKFGQLTYLRVYQGQVTRGDVVLNQRTQKKCRVPRLVRMHANEMEEVNSIGSGEICALFGMECNSGDTLTDASLSLVLSRMFVPEPVMALSIAPKNTESMVSFQRALNRFQREDPTFRVSVDEESKETIISGMGELHLDIYVERMKREYRCQVQTSRPRVAYRETISQAQTPFSYCHKKQNGGAGQYAAVEGYMEPIYDANGKQMYLAPNEFVNRVVSGTVPTEFIPCCEKAFFEASRKFGAAGFPSGGIRFVLTGGDSHEVDSNEHAFRAATLYAYRNAIMQAGVLVLEPIMHVTLEAPSEFQGAILGAMNRRRGVILDTENRDDWIVCRVEMALNSMFGFSTDLRSLTQGKGEFSMDYFEHQPLPTQEQEAMIQAFEKTRLLSSIND